MFKRYRETSLIGRIIAGIVIGMLLGILVPQLSAISLLGQLFVEALKGIAPVMVFFIITSAISRFQGGGKNHFGTVIIVYLLATLLSAAVGIIASLMFKVRLIFPSSVDIDASSAPKALSKVLSDLLINTVGNPLQAIATGNYLSILFWAVLLGFAFRLTSAGTRQVLTDVANTITAVAQLIIELAPIGIVGLMFATISETGFAGVARYGQLVTLLVGAMAFVYLVVYPLIVWVMTRQNPYPLTLWTLKVSGIPAFFTRSGAVNIPINLKACEDLELDEASYAVSIPLGASANSGGAAITIVIMTLAACYTLGITVSLPLIVLLGILAALASTGVSGIAGGSLLIIPMAASLFGISNDIAMQVVGVGFIIGVIQDAVETAVNSAADLLFTAAAEYRDRRVAGDPVDMKLAVKQAKAKE